MYAHIYIYIYIYISLSLSLYIYIYIYPVHRGARVPPRARAPTASGTASLSRTSTVAWLAISCLL